MQIMYMIPWLDIFLGLTFLGLIALGFWQGLLKELWFLIALYLSLILASLGGDVVAAFLQQKLSVAAPEIASTWGFLAVTILGTLIFYSLLYALVGGLRLPSSLLALDKIGGVTLGMITSLLLTTFFAFALQAIIPLGPKEWAFTEALKAQRLTSPLLRLFVATRPVVLGIVQVWLPEEIQMPYFLTIESPY